MRLSHLKTYWKNAATNNIAIGHDDVSNNKFCVFTAEDALSNLKEMTGLKLCLELPEVSLYDANSDNIRTITRGAVLILNGAMQGNRADIIQVFEQTEVVAYELLSKMLNDRKRANEQGRNAPESLIKHLDLNKVNMVEVGPVFDSQYGWRINYEFNSPVNLELDESKWLEGSEVKWTNI
jgi:hypothetical protein